ncbi:C13 family peptidase [Moraxella sp. ZJ142]|uniref:C13 family peptidase n=1 Tax=Moraxella marmotae TaxID=3344520 RepID=UPI0035D40AF4
MGFFSNFFSNLGASLWMLAGSTRAFGMAKPTFAQFVFFMLVALSVNILFAWLVASPDSYFNEQGLISYLVWPTIIVAAGIIVAQRSLNYSLLFVPAILWLAADTLLVLFQSSIQFLENEAWLPYWLHSILPTVFLLLFVWQTTALLLIFAKRFGWPWWERLLMLIATIALLVVWQKNTINQPIFKTDEVVIELDEEAFYRQSQVFEQALNNLAVQQKGRHDWYFLGVAAYADQDVFASEITQIRQLFDVRFGTNTRSLTLINNPKTWGDYPIATRTGIEQSLNRIAERMDTDEDVLFMVLSSHGTVNESNEPTGEIAVNNPPLSLRQIDPFWLKNALDQSGIRWRVIVVSACYSGSFIDVLKDPYTLIITASKANKASFGCTDDAQMTYFGRAFFAESMRQNSDIMQAFYAAVPKIKEREILMGFEPSEPQMAVGEMMQLALPELQKTLFNHHKDTALAND